MALASTIWAQPSLAASNSHAPAHVLTITLKGKIGPVLSGSDPLGINGTGGKVTIKANEALKPTKHTATSATYTLPAGAIKVTAGSNQFTTTSTSKMTINLKSTGDTLTLVVDGPDGLQVTSTTVLQTGSWTDVVLQHPAVFTPSPQKLTSAKTAGGLGCKIKYTIFGSSTVLGFKGTGASSATAAAALSHGLNQ
ncbi:MAG TPA: hypothetical protein VGP65_07790 [Candidatus Angelobacter sp.]|jgi:hypothetical protein|nr:hypothetical protein [Candidatus Angelobacter sp.]